MDTCYNSNSPMNSKLTPDLTEEVLDDFCKKASSSFFRQYGLISHQLNSYNDFPKNGLQNVFDSLGEINVQPGNDPSEIETVRRHATVKLGKVNLDRPTFWAGESFSTENGTEYLKLLPKHARLQNITYSSRMSVPSSISDIFRRDG
ncbi:hypothetical protein QVD17_36084 [Tagetes erecta]|uniref:DNA-directed RNA polymerase n=1 Tax=Tagetes erecta TaxID=13708 RepID=A0AAD8JTQ8_TARER|nr:hypothetical protein QVD17_36084 [Tagetes erecta]